MVLSQTEARAELARWVAEKGSQKEAAKALGIPQSVLSEVLSGRRDVSGKLAQKLGLARRIVYERIK